MGELEDNISPPSEDNETTSSGEGEFLLAVRIGLATLAPHWSGSPHRATLCTPATRLGPHTLRLAVELNRRDQEASVPLSINLYKFCDRVIVLY